MSRKRQILLAIGGVLAGVVAFWLYGSVYGKPHRELLSRLDAAKSAANRLEAEIEKDQFRVTNGLKAIAKRTLGRKLDAVEHRLREDLSLIAVRSGVRVESVASGAPSVEPNPAAITSIPTALKTRLKREPDFSVIKGSFRGEGELAAVLRMISAVQSQPWLLRVDGFDIKPVNKERSLFSLRLDIATPFVSDLGPETTDASIAEPPAGSEAMWATMAERNPFRDAIPVVPPPPVLVAQGPPTEPVRTEAQPALGAAYADWRLTGVAESRHGVEILLMNSRTGERLSLAVGSKVMDAVVVSGEGEQAVFEINGVRYTVLNGQTLADRRPVG